MNFPEVVVALNNNIAVPMATPLTTKTELCKVSLSFNVEVSDLGAGLEEINDNRDRDKKSYVT